MTEINPGPGLGDPAKKVGPGLRMLLDLGPLVVFFLANRLAPGSEIDKIVFATGAFIVAMTAAMAVDFAISRKVAKLHVISFALVVGFGAITIYLRDEQFIKMKPTAFYGLAAIILGGGWLMGKPLLKWMLGTAYPGLSDEGWMKFSRNWAIFFVLMACLNEVIWRNFSTGFWIGAKIWAFIPLTLGFVFANMPMLVRHGLKFEQSE